MSDDTMNEQQEPEAREPVCGMCGRPAQYKVGMLYLCSYECEAREPLAPPAVEGEREHAARLLAKSVPDALLDEVRHIWGNTNVHVIQHWRDIVLRSAPAPAAEPDDDDVLSTPEPETIRMTGTIVKVRDRDPLALVFDDDDPSVGRAPEAPAPAGEDVLCKFCGNPVINNKVSLAIRAHQPCVDLAVHDLASLRVELEAARAENGRLREALTRLLDWTVSGRGTPHESIVCRTTDRLGGRHDATWAFIREIERALALDAGTRKEPTP